MTQPSDPIFDGTNPHAMVDDTPSRSFMNLVGEILRRVQDSRQLIDEGRYDYERAFVMVEKQAMRVRDYRLHPKYGQRNIREVIKQIIPLIPADLPEDQSDYDYCELRDELVACASDWFSAPEIEMPLWIGVATSLEQWLETTGAHGPTKEGWPDWKWQVLAIFSGQDEAVLRASVKE